MEILVILLSSSLLLNGVLGEPLKGDYVEEDYQADYYNDEYNYVDTSRENGSSVERIERRNPKFISTAKRVVVNEGATIKLPCDVDNLEGFMLIWKRGNDMISVGETILKKGDSRIKIESHENGNNLVISLAGQSDAGPYTCQINSPENKVLTHNVDIRVAPLVSVGDVRVEVEAGQTAVLDCTASQGTPDPQLYWSRKARMFRSGASRINGGRLELVSVTRKDAGLYTCHGDNGWGYTANSTVQLVVLHAPEIEQEETFIHTEDGAEVEVTCTVHAAPAATVSWYQNGELLDPESTVFTKRGNRHTLYVTGIGSPNTFGKYMCRAINPLGEASKTTEVSGLAKPAMYLTDPEDINPKGFQLHWTVQSNAVVEQFRIDYREASGEHQWIYLYGAPEQQHQGVSDVWEGRVAIHNLLPGTKYEAKVDARNMYGWSNHNHIFQFTTKPKPSVPTKKVPPTVKSSHNNDKNAGSEEGRESAKPQPAPSISTTSATAAAAATTQLSLLALSAIVLVKLVG